MLARVALARRNRATISMGAAAAIACALASTSCGGPSASGAPRSEAAGQAGRAGQGSEALAPPARPPNEPEAFVATRGVGDVIAPYARPERSSRLDGTFPKGRAREVFRVPLEESIRPSFVLAAGNRVAVAGPAAYVSFDTHGRHAEAGTLDVSLARIDRLSGKVFAATEDQVPPGDVKSQFAMHDGACVVAAGRSILIVPRTGESRRIDGAFDALDVAIDEQGVAQVLVRQTNDLSLWSAPVAGPGSTGRMKLPVTTRAARTPPILGTTMRVLALDDRLVALALDGKKLWERRGALTGGASITADDRLLVADGPKIYAVDRGGRVTNIAVVQDVIFVTPPILNAGGMLFVASGKALHAYAFDPSSKR